MHNLIFPVKNKYLLDNERFIGKFYLASQFGLYIKGKQNFIFNCVTEILSFDLGERFSTKLFIHVGYYIQYQLFWLNWVIK